MKFELRLPDVPSELDYTASQLIFHTDPARMPHPALQYSVQTPRNCKTPKIGLNALHCCGYIYIYIYISPFPGHPLQMHDRPPCDRQAAGQGSCKKADACERQGSCELRTPVHGRGKQQKTSLHFWKAVFHIPLQPSSSFESCPA